MDTAPESLVDMAVSTGTTIVAAAYRGGVVLGADSRVTTGIYVSNRVSDKITPLADSIYLCRSGSAADTQAVSDYVRHTMDQMAMELPDGRPSVRTAANVAMQINYFNKDMLLAGMICAGWDKYEGGSVYALPIGGSMIRVPYTVGGSGSTFIYGFCDAEYKDDMTREECEEFVMRAVAHAMSRDGSSGGLIRLVTVNEGGAERRMIQGPEIPLFVDELAN